MIDYTSTIKNPIRKKIAEEALTWRKTPYHDHAGIKFVGVDCAHFPLRVFQAVDRIPKDFVVPYYSPQQWLNSPSQKDKFHLRVEDKTFLNIVLQFAKREIKEEEVQPGDFVIYKVVASWTHGGIIIKWPEYVLHPIIGLGVVGSHGTTEGFLQGRPRRFFSVFTEEEDKINGTTAER
jgi:cell wall-associated NlpC family hydrolase